MEDLFVHRLERAGPSRLAQAIVWARGTLDIVSVALLERIRPERLADAVVRPVGRDLRYALRQMLRAPGFHLTAIAVLALGIGLNSAAFSVVRALVLRPPTGVEEPDRLVRVYRSFPGGSDYGANSVPHVRDLRDAGEGTFQGVAAWDFITVSLGTMEGNEVLTGQVVSADFFEVLGTEAAIGRTFGRPQVEADGGTPVVVLGHASWQTRFGGDPSVVGSEIRLNGRPFVVVGVTPRGFTGATRLHAPELWVPLSTLSLLQPTSDGVQDDRNANFLGVIARLRDDASLETARAGAEALLAALRERHPDVYEGTGIQVAGLDEVGTAAEYGRLAWTLMGVVAVLLLLACVNVANMLVARGAQRRTEIGIRMSLGAGRARVVRQLLAENLLLAVFAGLAATVLASAVLGILGRAPLFPSYGLSVDLALDRAVLAYTLVAALGTVFVFGLVPALEASRCGNAEVVRRPRSGPARVASGLVAAQTALSVVLLTSAALFLQSVWTAGRTELGFEADRLLAADFLLSLSDLERTEAEAFYPRLADRLMAGPEVVGVTWTDIAPLGSGRQATRVTVPGFHSGDADGVAVDYARVGARYFETLGVGMIRGRDIAAMDDASAPGVVVVNRAMAERFWPDRNPLGATVETQGGKHLTVVGVAENARTRTLTGPVEPAMFLSIAQGFAPDATVLVRSTGDPLGLRPTLRSVAARLDPRIAVRNERSVESQVATVLLPTRAMAGALALFGVLGLLLSTAGLYRIVSYVVTRERKEIGIRIALGADRATVLGSVVARGVKLSLLGVALGAVAAYGASELIRSVVVADGSIQREPLAVAAVSGLLVAVAALASWIPARRAARVDPWRALRSE